MKFQQSCGAQKGRPRALRLTVAALGALLMPGIGWKDGVLRFLVWAISAALRPRALLIAENVCLRHQLGVLQRRHRQPRLRNGDRQFWICASRWFAGWRRDLGEPVSEFTIDAGDVEYLLCRQPRIDALGNDKRAVCTTPKLVAVVVHRADSSQSRLSLRTRAPRLFRFVKPWVRHAYWLACERSLRWECLEAPTPHHLPRSKPSPAGEAWRQAPLWSLLRQSVQAMLHTARRTILALYHRMLSRPTWSHSH
jgi:hypothetical protein